jgi:multiple sugar transport system substrate-binding protein
MSLTRRGGAVLATAASVLALAGCAGGNQPAATVDLANCTAEGTVLSVAAPPTAKAAFDVAIPAFEAAHPGITVEAKELAGKSYNEYAQQIIGDMASGVAVDVANIGHDQVRLFTDTYDVPAFDTGVLHDSYDASFLPVGQVGGEQYAIPFQVSVAGLYRNTDALAAAGVTTTAPTSLDEVIALAQSYTAATGSPAVSIDAGVGGDDWYLQMLTQSLGGEFVTDGKPAFDSAAGEEAFSFYGDGASEGFLQRVPAADSLGAFASGKVPMVVISSAAVPLFTKQIADTFAWDMQLFPASAETKYAAGGNSWIALAQDGCQSAFAQEFIAEIVSTDALLATLKGYGYLPVDTGAREALLADAALDPRTRGAYETEITMTPFGGWPGSTTPEVQRAIADAVDRIVAGADVSAEVPKLKAQIDGIVG